MADDRLATQFLPENNEQFTPSVPQVDDPEAFSRSFAAGLWANNTILSATKAITDDQPWAMRRAQDYNPYRRLKELYPQETQEQLKSFVSDGMFDDVHSDDQLADRVRDAQDRLKPQDGWGYFAGSVFASVVDPTSYIPFVGEGLAAGRLGRVGVAGLNAALSAGVSETALQATQRDRSWQDSLMNIGTAGLIGGGLGIFADALHPKSRLNPRNGENPLRPENFGKDGEITRDMTGATDELSPEELRDYSDNYVAAGAKPLIDDIPTIAGRGEPTTGIGRATRKIGDVVNSATIKGQVLRAQSGIARWVGVRIFDPAGILFEHNLRGIGNAPSATMLKQNYMGEYERLVSSMQADTRALSTEMSGHKADYKDVLKLTQRRLYSMDDPALNDVIARKYGNDAEKMHQLAGQLTDRIHEFNTQWEKRLTDHGLMQDPHEVSRLTQELKFHRERIKALAPMAGVDDAAETAGGKAARDAELKGLRATRDDLIARLRVEKQKPVPMGRDYGHAQVWNRDHLFSNPSAVKSFLHDVLSITPDEDWLLENHHMTLEEFLSSTDATAKREIREEWAGDAYDHRVHQLTLDLSAVTERQKQSKLDFMETLRSLKAAKRDETDITLTEARKRRDAIHTRIAANKVRRAALEKEVRSFREGATAARMAGLDRAERIGQTPEEALRDTRAAQSERASTKAKDTVLEAQTDPLSPTAEAGQTRFMDAGDVVQSLDKEAAANNRLVSAEARTRQNGDNVSVPTARQEGKAKEAGLGLNALIRETDELETRAAKLDEKLREMESLHETITATRRDLTEATREAKSAHEDNVKSASKIGKQLKAARKATPLNEMIEQVYANLADRGTTPQGIIDKLLETSDREVSRVKRRSLNLTREQRAYAISQGWLRDDLSNILHLQTDQLASELSLREALDIGKGKTFGSWGEVIDRIHRDYQDRIEAADTQKERDALSAEMQKTVANIVMARDRFKGGVHVDDGTANGWLGWTTSKMKQANMIRYGSGFSLASLTDTATVALRHPHMARMLMRHGRQAVQIMRQAAHEDPTRFRSMIAAVEIAAGAHGSARRFGTEDVLNGHLYGYGIGHGRVRQITSAIDRGAEALSEIGIKMGGLPYWNSFWKTVAGLDMLDRLHSLSATGWDKLSPAEQADLASLGLGSAESRRLSHYMTTYAEKDANGHLDPHFEKWEGAEGQSAARDAEMAIMRDMDRAINTPDVGDTPRLMSTHLGSLLLSFQTFAFTFMNQYAYPLAQRMALFHEKAAFMSLGILFGAAAVVMAGKDILAQRDPTERFKPENWGHTAYDLVDRSGLLGWTSPYIDSALKLTPLGGGSRYSRNNALQSVLGINAGLVGDVGNAVAAVSSGDPHAARKVLVLAPFNTQARLLNRVFDHNP